MANLRAQVVLQNRNNHPADAVVNTFHFTSDVGKTDPDLVTGLISFYNTVHAPGTNSIGYYLSNNLSRNAGTMRIKVYDMAEPKPREPVESIWALDDLGSADPLPNEMAACLSFYADRNLARRRGRVYIGPLMSNAGAEDLTAGDVRLTNGFRDALVGGGTYLLTLPGSATWCTHSTVDNAWRPVTAGWVDTAFDVQRRRGLKPGARVTWGEA
jgi:hypothetical protein